MPERAGYIYKELTLSCDTVQYADGDVLAAPQAIAGVFRGGHPVRLESLAICDKDDQGGALELWLLGSNVSMGSENAALAVTDAVADEIVSIVPVGTADYTDLGSSQFALRTYAEGDAGMGAVMAPAGGDSLYIGAVSRDTSTHTAAGVTLKLGFSDLRN